MIKDPVISSCSTTAINDILETLSNSFYFSIGMTSCGFVLQVVFLQHQLDAGLLISAIPLCLLSRAVNVFPLSWLANKGRYVVLTKAKIMKIDSFASVRQCLDRVIACQVILLLACRDMKLCSRTV